MTYRKKLMVLKKRTSHVSRQQFINPHRKRSHPFLDGASINAKSTKACLVVFALMALSASSSSSKAPMIRTSTWLLRKIKFQHVPPRKKMIRFKKRCLGIICGRDCCTEQRMRHQPGRSTVATKRFKKKLGGSPRLVDLKGHGRIDVQPWLQDPSDTSGRVLDHEAKTCAKIYHKNLSFHKKMTSIYPPVN